MSENLYPSQEGTWTLTAPDGRQWTAESGLHAAVKEQRERIPPEVMLERIFANLEPSEEEKELETLRAQVAELTKERDEAKDELRRVRGNAEKWILEAQSLAAATFERTRQRAVEVARERLEHWRKICQRDFDHKTTDAHNMACRAEAATILEHLTNLPPEEPRNG